MPRDIPITSWGDRILPTSSWEQEQKLKYLLQESLWKLLLENGNWAILLENSLNNPFQPAPRVSATNWN